MLLPCQQAFADSLFDMGSVAPSGLTISGMIAIGPEEYTCHCTISSVYLRLQYIPREGELSERVRRTCMEHCVYHTNLIAHINCRNN